MVLNALCQEHRVFCRIKSTMTDELASRNISQKQNKAVQILLLYTTM